MTATPRPWVALALLALVLGAALAGCGRSPTEAETPPEFSNLVVVMIDALRSDHLEAYGYSRDTAPFLARLAEEGIRLQARSASSWTRPSVATALTGLYPQRHQATTRGDRLPADVPYLPSILASSGFETLAYVSNPSVGSDFEFHRGFARHDEYIGGKYGKPSAKQVTDRALDLATSATQPATQPYFLYVHYLDPHDPYVPKRVWERDAGAGEVVQPEDLLQGKVEMTDQVLQQLRDQYDGAIREMDREIRRLVERLGATGLLRRTLVVVTSDHGELFGEHGGLTHGRGLWEEELRVPLIFWSEEGLKPRSPAEGFHHVDLMPTLLEALGVQPPTGLDGRSLWPEIVSGELPRRDSWLHSLDLQPGAAALALVKDEHKLIHRSIQPSTLLFRLDSDAAELQNLTHQHDRREDLLYLAVEAHNRLSAQRFGRSTGRLDDAMRQNLAALGYIDDAGMGAPDLTFQVRTLPDAMTVHGAPAFGLFGGVSSAELSSVLDLRQESVQLLQGWPRHWLDPVQGARSRRQANLVLGRDQAGRRDLVLQGRLDEAARAVRVEVRCGDWTREQFSLEPGPVEVWVAGCAPAVGAAPVRVELRLWPEPRLDRVRGGGVLWSRIALAGKRSGRQSM